MAEKRSFAAGMRIVVRDAEWLVKHVGAVHHEGGRIFTVLTCVGVSNLVSGRTSKFIVEYEERPELKQKIQILDPKETRLVQDDSVNYVRTRLFIDALLRRTPATDAKIHIAQDAAMDVLAYQLEPAVWALESTRPRILIADAVGIGKTLEAERPLPHVSRTGLLGHHPHRRGPQCRRTQLRQPARCTRPPAVPPLGCAHHAFGNSA